MIEKRDKKIATSSMEPVDSTESFHLAGRTLGNDLLVSKCAVSIDIGSSQDCFCPYCRRRLHAKVLSTESSKPRRAPPVLSEKENAYAALMYGTAPAYFLGALVTGWSLQAHSIIPKHARILLCTDDVPDTFLRILGNVWTIRRVEYIDKASSWFYWDYYNSRFKQVFTKLRILHDLEEFKKVILLDLDLLIRGEVDSLFDLPAPAAMVRGQCSLQHGEEVPIDTFFYGHRQVLGINCGVMLIEPNRRVFQRMLREIKTHWHPEHWPSHGPEQDYLSRYYNAFGRWTNMSCRYNYQVHLTQFGSLEWHHYNRRNHPDVSVFHFSGKLVKPWEFILDLRIVHGLSYSEIETFVKGLYPKALVSMREKIAEMSLSEKPKSAGRSVGIKSHFCYGIAEDQKGSHRCYLDRYIHASWSEADSDAVIEWLRCFQEADQSTDFASTEVLRILWQQEIAQRP